MVNKVTFVGFRGRRSPHLPPLDRRQPAQWRYF